MPRMKTARTKAIEAHAVSVLLTSALHKVSRVKAANILTKMEFPWLNGDTPKLQMITEYLQCCPASSANVERSFSAHARAHCAERASLGEANVMTQLGLHSLLKWQNGDFVTKLPKEVEAERVVNSCLMCWCASRFHLLKPNESVVVWFETQKRLMPYRGRLVEEVNGTWKVRWSGDPNSSQKLNPQVDPWLLANE